MARVMISGDMIGNMNSTGIASIPTSVLFIMAFEMNISGVMLRFAVLMSLSIWMRLYSFNLRCPDSQRLKSWSQRSMFLFFCEPDLMNACMLRVVFRVGIRSRSLMIKKAPAPASMPVIDWTMILVSPFVFG